MLFLYGPGGNGKGVFLNTLTRIIGDYATVAAMETFTASKHDSHPTDLAMLRGARLVCASETEEGRNWDEKRIKRLTGGDPITARFMRQDFFTYQPQFKLLTIGNYKPSLRNVDDAIKRRFNLGPFLHKPDTVDKQLEEKLKDEWPSILRWMIAGCLDWQANGLVRPPVVADATNEYFAEEDAVGQWIEERCIRQANVFDETGRLYGDWKLWAELAGERVIPLKLFRQALKTRGFRQFNHHLTRRSCFEGLRLKYQPKE